MFIKLQTDLQDPQPMYEILILISKYIIDLKFYPVRAMVVPDVDKTLCVCLCVCVSGVCAHVCECRRIFVNTDTYLHIYMIVIESNTPVHQPDLFLL